MGSNQRHPTLQESLCLKPGTGAPAKKTRKSHPGMRSQKPGKCYISTLQTRKDHSSLQGTKVSETTGLGPSQAAKSQH